MIRRQILSLCILSATLLVSSCGSDGTTTTNATTTNAYAAAYQAAKFNNGSGGNLTVSFPSSCSMTVSSTGAPYQHAVYYLVPVGVGGTVVATTPSGIQLALTAYAGSGVSNYKSFTGTFNICPTKAATTTTAGMGGIGLMFSGNEMFNPYEATSTTALADNVTYTFASTACGGTTCTAGFLDTCSEHTNNTGIFHYHGDPTCWTSNVDGATGASHIIGIALDGFPIYGGRDVNGAIVPVTSLDSCNGITSPTPEFPNGAYHYVLPLDSNGNALATNKSSLNCYAGTVNATLSAMMKQLGCKRPMLLANGKLRLPDGRDVTHHEAELWMKQNMASMPGMQMASMELPSAENVHLSGELMAATKHHNMANMPGM